MTPTRSLVLLSLLVVAACSDQHLVPGPTSPTILPAAPKAVLTIAPGSASAPLGVVGFTSFTFDASRSTGQQLTYALELGDGTTSATAISSRTVNRRGEVTAKLTVTDEFGRSDSTTQAYFVGVIENDDNNSFWYVNLPGRQVRLDIGRNGSALSGRYHESSPNPVDVFFRGTLTGERALSLRTDDGTVEMSGTLEWLPSEPFSLDQNRLVLRLVVRGGIADGGTRDFRFADPY